MKNLSNREIFALITAVGVLLASSIAVVTYLNNRKYRDLQGKNAELENKIKQLQLIKLTSELDDI